MIRSGSCVPTGTAQAPSCAAAGVVAPSSAATATTVTPNIRVLVDIGLVATPLLRLVAKHELVVTGVARLDADLDCRIRIGATGQVLVVVPIETQDVVVR